MASAANEMIVNAVNPEDDKDDGEENDDNDPSETCGTTKKKRRNRNKKAAATKSDINQPVQSLEEQNKSGMNFLVKFGAEAADPKAGTSEKLHETARPFGETTYITKAISSDEDKLVVSQFVDWFEEDFIPLFCPSNMAEVMSENLKLTKLINDTDPLLFATKLKCVLENLEQHGKPMNIDLEEWKGFTSADKWRKMVSVNEIHPLIKKFIQSTGKDSFDEVYAVVDRIYNYSFKVTDEFFSKKRLDLKILELAGMDAVLKCLHELDIEITCIPPTLLELYAAAESAVNATDPRKVKVDDEKNYENDKFSTREPYFSEEALEVHMNGVSLEDYRK